MSYLEKVYLKIRWNTLRNEVQKSLNELNKSFESNSEQKIICDIIKREARKKDSVIFSNMKHSNSKLTEHVIKTEDFNIKVSNDFVVVVGRDMVYINTLDYPIVKLLFYYIWRISKRRYEKASKDIDFDVNGSLSKLS
jgi:hypothetical protein